MGNIADSVQLSFTLKNFEVPTNQQIVGGTILTLGEFQNF
jgi:hypothetical protein